MAVFFDGKLGGCSCARSKCSDECSTYRIFKPKPQTNADRIRSMTDEELAHLLHSAEEHLFNGNLWDYAKWLDWLRQEAR